MTDRQLQTSLTLLIDPQTIFDRTYLPLSQVVSADPLGAVLLGAASGASQVRPVRA